MFSSPSSVHGHAPADALAFRAMLAALNEGQMSPRSTDDACRFVRQAHDSLVSVNPYENIFLS